MLKSRLFEKDRVVQERWHRMNFHRKYSKRLKSLFLVRLYIKLKLEFRAKDIAINKAIATTVYEAKRLDAELFPATKEFFNIGLYFLLAERDLQALKADAFAHPNLSKRSIALRTLLLTIYEWDMGKVTGRRMHNIYQMTNLSDEQKNELVSALKDLKKARKSIESKFALVRHSTIAHREPNALAQYETIEHLDLMKLSKEISIFYIASNRLLKALVSSLLEMRTVPSMLHQIGSSKKSA
ncbi:hypothetical protein GNP61_19305 [Aliivibrio fischeri]|uniref:hypothetical protein n=1 Tax=Aliivibrio fischeri TaxID=668 RepID=UPI0012DA2EE4|nr:hypothetical protein [Aliivibrio fischeri]MUK43698.1 hypothetical protein [Aliivibrio fischeri]